MFCGQDVRRPEQGRRKEIEMNETLTTLDARTAEADRFVWHADPPAPFRGIDETELERLKNRLLRSMLDANTTTALIPALRRAANEAAAVAWLESHPLLVFPALFEEKALAARKRNHRQGLIHSRSQLWMEEAA